ncbi:hypothetical protein PLESTB_001375400 [Pleodorina starrii]|uniref:Kelch repeat-containing protein n=1 Tax=Pleodorina starrii TaxID=330485 RepID=A0A9W6BUS2_9CHLO|nr:hypothetical protein PLESTM_000409700 [Pleodorina starrii]GLC58568.1 hypothetical protein PLESTB_001375400 [Pleodorina starrii]GLC74223.1 hypothetical protein PLESTF_001475400 [Pleodorina starrii]
MGSGRDKRKKAKERKDGPVAGVGSVKTEKKTAKNEAKKERRADKRLEGDEDDIDALLMRMALEERQKKGTLEVVPDCDPPGPRVNASFVPYVTPRGSFIFMFGGEYVDVATDKVHVYKDLYRFDVDKKRWARVDAPNGPPPRSAHQAVIVKNTMFVFGGEFTSPNQEKFHHYKDLWRLDLTTWEWDCLPLKGGPSARSGHRMALQPLRNRVLLFGGFYDTGRDVKYYNDLWELNLETLKWTSLGGGPAGNAGAGAVWPSPRSGCGLAVVGETLWVFGGYSKAKDDEDEDLEHGKTMDDVWACNLTNNTWERVKKVGMAPGARASFSVAVHSHPKAGPRAFVFGGVSDNEAKGGEDLSSEFHNDLYTFNFERRRWFAAELRPPATGGAAGGGKGGAGKAASADAASSSDDAATAAAAAGGSSSSSAATAAAPIVSPEMADRLAAATDRTSALYRAAVKIQASYRGYVVRKAYQLYRIGGVVSEILYSPATYGLDLSVLNIPKPKARICALTTIVGSTLWLLGGTVEVGSKEITLDDMWALDVVKLDGWQLVRENTVGEELLKKAAAGDGSDSEWTEASDGDLEDDDEDDDEEEEEAEKKKGGKGGKASAASAAGGKAGSSSKK